MPKLLVLWDVDGTLIDSNGVSAEVYGTAYELLAGSPSVPFTVTDGSTDYLIMEDVYRVNSRKWDKNAEEHLEETLIEAMSQKRAELETRGVALEGAQEAITALQDTGEVLQSALTGNIADNARAKLGSCGLGKGLDFSIGGYGSDARARFELVRYAQGRAAAKYGGSFNMNNTLLIGDTVLDVEAGQRGGAQVLAVATGKYSTQSLKDAGASAVLEDLSKTEQFLKTVEGFLTVEPHTPPEVGRAGKLPRLSQGSPRRSRKDRPRGPF